MRLSFLRTRAARATALFALATAVGGCFGDLTENGAYPFAMQITTGTGLSVAPNAELSAPLGVRVIDQYGAPFEGARVRWEIVQGGGTITATETQTDADGRTSVRFTAGADLGTSLVSASQNSIGIVVFRNTIGSVPR